MTIASDDNLPRVSSNKTPATNFLLKAESSL